MSKRSINGEAIARENERYIIREVTRHGSIREDELSIILSMSLQMVQRTTRRLEAAGEIIRTRAHSSYFISMKKRSDTASIPPAWRHNALAILVLGFIRDNYPSAVIETEAQIRERIQQGKIPDGQITGSGPHIRIEVEMTHKSSRPMEKQSKEAVLLAKQGVTTIFAYPYPPNKFFYKYDWEVYLPSSLRTELGHDNHEPYIKLLQCHMPGILEFNHCRPTKYVLIDLPQLPVASRIGQGKKTLGSEEIRGFNWKILRSYLENNCRHEISALYWDNHKCGTYKFMESLGFSEGDAHEMLALNEKGEWVLADAFPLKQAWDVFSEFVMCGKENAEKLDSGLVQISV